MLIDLVTFGRPKLKFVGQGLAHYLGHLTGLATVNLVSLRAEPLTGQISPELARRREAERALARLQGQDPWLALDMTGRPLDSAQWIELLGRHESAGRRRLSLVIGGPHGLDSAVLAAADEVVSLSPLTLSHELCLLVALEQLYRALSQRAGRPYAK